MDMFTSPIHLSAMLADVHRRDLEIEIDADRRRRLVEPVRPRRTTTILARGRALIGAFLLELMPWPGSLADVDGRARQRRRAIVDGTAPTAGPAAPCPPATGSRSAAAAS